MAEGKTRLVSIVVPVHNEQENIRPLVERVTEVMSACECAYELIIVDDGSTDGTIAELEKISKEQITPKNGKSPRPRYPMKVVIFRRNFGQTSAIAAGFDHSQGSVIVPIDGDLQNDPTDIPRVVRKLEEGFDVVSGWRKNRQDTFLTRVLPSKMANWLISTVTGVHLHDYGCTLKAYRREVLTGFRLYGEMHRFIPAYAHSVGARMIELPVHHHARKYGKTKYGLTRTLKVVLDLFTVKFLLSYANKPIYLFGGTGLALIIISALVFIFLIIRRIFFQVDVLSSPFFQMSTMFTILGFQSILMGLIAELLVRTYHESQAKPTYTILKVILPKSETNE